ncbi:hypothetical protein [Salinarimonas ramus]|uniref:Uncharacterized protein n=1 Tax=Salinarimonas ramus TaxID=690164 RepID=A0A917QH54_9HYPH|nr:hypothetical protein [Salinarimonas ramus]GGK49646.1 hypothetical protein GCM10011322_40810 [Salinarimonas ramus]
MLWRDGARRTARACLIGCGLFIAAALAAMPPSIGPAAAQSALPDGRMWVVLASRQDPGEAIALARDFRWRFDATHVLTSANGWHAIVAGPLAVDDAGAQQARLRAEPGLPDDLFLADGARFEAPFWSSERPRLETLRFDGTTPLVFGADGATLVLETLRDEGDLLYPRLAAYENGVEAFAIPFEEAGSFSATAWLSIAPLDPQDPDARQIVASAFTGGAHCCAVTRVANRIGDDWVLIEGATLDGERGYDLRDVDGDGIYELASLDQSFLYAYAPYAGSFAPLVLERFGGKKIVDLARDPRFRSAYEQDLAWMEDAARESPGLWRENGFLAAWAAAMARLGRWEEARSRIAASHDRSGDWPLTICAAPRAEDGSCPPGAERPASFPEVLERHLRERGYLDG